MAKRIKINPKIRAMWHSMKNRCQNPKTHELFPTYIGCTYCKEWENLEVFAQWVTKQWYTIYKSGYSQTPDNLLELVLDKDIRVKGNKHYSPDRCCLIPQFINNLITQRIKKREDLGTGVSYVRTYHPYHYPLNAYYVTISYNGKTEYLGTFEILEDAIDAYCYRKEEIIKEVAQKYKLYLPAHIFEAMMKYEVAN